MQQNTTEQNKQTGVEPYKSVAFEAYITWRALGGLLIVEDDENTPNKIKIMTLEDFCTTFEVDRTTVWRWKTQTPNLAELIEKRRLEVTPLARVSAAWNQLFMLGMQTQDKRAAVDAITKYLGHFGNLQLPKQRQEVEAGNNLMELLNQARKRNIVDIQEGELVDDTGTST